MSSQHNLQRWIWRDLQVDLPGDWELLQFSKERERGRCAFADRYRFRFEMNWSMVQRAPDMQRLLKDYQSKLLRDKAAEDCAPAKIAGWHGLTGQQIGRPMSRFGHYFEEATCLVELVFLWADERDSQLENRVLRSFSHRPEQPGGLRLWRAFGMEWMNPAAMHLETCQVWPGHAALLFEEPRQRPHSMRFERLGMVDAWLRGSIEDWLNSRLPACVVDRHPERFHDSGRDLCGISGAYRPKGLLHRNGVYGAACWLEPADGRLFFIERIARSEPLPLQTLAACLKAATPHSHQAAPP